MSPAPNARHDLGLNAGDVVVLSFQVAYPGSGVTDLLTSAGAIKIPNEILSAALVRRLSPQQPNPKEGTK